MNIGQIIDDIRKEERLSLEALESISGVSKRSLHKWKQEEPAQILKINKVLDALGYELEVIKK